MQTFHVINLKIVSLNLQQEKQEEEEKNCGGKNERKKCNQIKRFWLFKFL